MERLDVAPPHQGRNPVPIDPELRTTSQEPMSRADRREMLRVAGRVWVIGAVLVLGSILLPGVRVTSWPAVAALGAGVAIYAVLCSKLDGGAVPFAGHLRASFFGAIAIGVLLWATGGTDSPYRPLVFLSVGFLSFYFPVRWACVLAVAMVLVVASPIAYESGAASHGFVALVLVYAGVIATTVWVAQTVRRRLDRAARRQREMAMRDPLTGMLNMRAFHEVLVQEIKRAGRSPEASPPALIAIDLDTFKDINDHHGHPAGDAVLRRVAAALAERVRGTDTVCRVGGDEFVVLAPEVGSEGARRLAGELLAAVRTLPGPGRSSLAASAGWALYPDHADGAASWVAAADRALLSAKRAGKDQAAGVGERAVSLGPVESESRHGPLAERRGAAAG